LKVNDFGHAFIFGKFSRFEKLTANYLLIIKGIRVISGVFFVGMIILLIIGIFHHRYKLKKLFNPTKIVAVIVAHNEEDSIGLVLDSCLDAHFNEVYLVADSCTDRTVEIAKSKSAHILEVNKKSKTLSLNATIPVIVTKEGKNSFYMFFDSGNIFKSSLLNDILPFIQAYPILQLRTRNLNKDSWVSRMFVIMSAFYFKVQNALMNLHLSTILAGFGWGAYGWVFRKYPFECNSVVDDFEYTLEVGLTIAYISTIDIFDEKTDDFIVSFKQRLRWTRGYFYEFFIELKKFKQKPYLLLIPLTLLFWIFSLFGLIKSVNLTFVISSFILNTLVFLATLDREDIKSLKPYDLFTFYFFNLTSLIIILFALFTFKDLSWYRTPHKGIVLKKTD
jgi:cellulose synthase/poly-beta-1,6-N-acetylglucosamine synthase-like glycosyltransferase